MNILVNWSTIVGLLKFLLQSINRMLFFDKGAIGNIRICSLSWATALTYIRYILFYLCQCYRLELCEYSSIHYTATVFGWVPLRVFDSMISLFICLCPMHTAQFAIFVCVIIRELCAKKVVVEGTATKPTAANWKR